MDHELQTIDIKYYKYTCENCDNPIYANYECPTNCPHCKEQCNEKTMSSREPESDIIVYSIDPKTSEILIWEESE